MTSGASLKAIDVNSRWRVSARSRQRDGGLGGTAFQQSWPFAAVVAKGSFGSRWTEGSADASGQPLQPESQMLSAACVPCQNLGDAVSNPPGSR